jgi:hypothetical protein
MGNIRKFDLGRIVKDFKVRNFVETGTFHGDAVEYALTFPFQTIWSVEIIPGLAEECRKRFIESENVTIVCGDSVSALKEYIPRVKGNSVYWLDAHFPGADAGLTSYESDDETLRLPLSLELQTIAEARDTSKDVFILDDLRIYEDGNYEKGSVPEDAAPSGPRNIDFVEELFGRTHKIIRSYSDEGYLILFPQRKYFWKHFSFARLTGREVDEDPYLL